MMASIYTFEKIINLFKNFFDTIKMQTFLLSIFIYELIHLFQK